MHPARGQDGGGIDPDEAAVVRFEGCGGAGHRDGTEVLPEVAVTVVNPLRWASLVHAARRCVHDPSW
jgi:hypothetical protein